MLANAGQIQKIVILVNQLGIQDMKTELVGQVSGGRESSSKGLTMGEAAKLISHLESMSGNPQAPRPERTDKSKESPEQKMRKKIISMCYEMQMTGADGKIDMTRVNALVRDKGYLKANEQKHNINGYTLKELPKLIYQFEQFRDHYLTKKANES